MIAKEITKKSCYFCSQDIDILDYKDAEFLRKFISGHAKILPPRRSGTCPRHQRRLAEAIKRARFMALLPFTTR